ncbi:sigma-70 family RNA polymerase sigma factor [Actinoplanes sp. NPDC049265]|uniref:sigma-70 family RNA polymerase sigma factor n=1 Tax=Actinoplanes sp. NPDC049265 TaxID=3363902 RepID=UPI00371D1FF1
MPSSRPAPVAGNAAETEALRRLQKVHGPVLHNFLTRLTRGDSDWADDIRQETLARAWHSPEARDADGRWNRVWLFTIAGQILLDQVREAGTGPDEGSGRALGPRAPAEDDITELMDASSVRAALDQLPERLRLNLIEVYFQQRSVSETADRLAVAPSTVRTRTFHGLTSLRDTLIGCGFTFPARTTGD